MSERIKISVTILTKDSSRHLQSVLESVREFDDVVILDGGSKDDTVDIVNRFTNTNLFHEEFIGFGALKNKAIELAKHDWVFSLDSDEIVSEDLIQEIRNIDRTQDNRAFEIDRKNYFCDRLIKHGGWSPDWLIRIFNRKTARFSND